MASLTSYTPDNESGVHQAAVAYERTPTDLYPGHAGPASGDEIVYGSARGML